MKKLILTLISVYLTTCLIKAAEEQHARPLTPAEEEAYFQSLSAFGIKSSFDYSLWNECRKPLTGNYSGHSCATNRRLGVMLKEYMEDQLRYCLEDISQELGYELEDFHIVHSGIFADRRHSPRSLHSIGRAIDVNRIKIKQPNGKTLSYHYGKQGEGAFFKKLRSCWGKSVHESNSCPVINSYEQTASIGKENRNHQNHLHLSVPYCIGGAYAGNYFRR